MPTKTETHEFEMTLEDGRDVTAIFMYSPYVAATVYDRKGDPGDPEEGPEVDIVSLMDGDGDDILESLDDAAADELKQRILEDWDPE